MQHPFLLFYQMDEGMIINPRRACAARVTVVCLFVTVFMYVCMYVCMYVSDTTLDASVVVRTLKFRHQRSVNDTLERFDSWILKYDKICKLRSSSELISVDF